MIKEFLQQPSFDLFAYSKFTIPLPTSECRLSKQPLYISIQSHIALNKQALPIGLDVFQNERTVENLERKKPRSTAAVLSPVAGQGGRRDQGGGRHCQLGPVNVRNLRLIRGLLTL